MNYIFFILKENWNLPTFLRKKKIFLEGRDRATQGGHGSSRFLFLKLRVYMFYEISRIWAKENNFRPVNISFVPFI